MSMVVLHLGAAIVRPCDANSGRFRSPLVVEFMSGVFAAAFLKSGTTPLTRNLHESSQIAGGTSAALVDCSTGKGVFDGSDVSPKTATAKLQRKKTPQIRLISLRFSSDLDSEQNFRLLQSLRAIDHARGSFRPSFDPACFRPWAPDFRWTATTLRILKRLRGFGHPLQVLVQLVGGGSAHLPVEIVPQLEFRLERRKELVQILSVEASLMNPRRRCHVVRHCNMAQWKYRLDGILVEITRHSRIDPGFGLMAETDRVLSRAPPHLPGHVLPMPPLCREAP